jgi:hypothetical protein
MKGSTTVSDLSELNDDGYEVESGTSQNGEPESTVEAPQSKRQPKVNLDDFEDFRKFKASVQQREERAARERAEIARELEAQRAWRRQVEMAGMDEVERAKYERDEALRMVQAIKQEEAFRYQNWQWEQLIEEVSRETGVPKTQLEEAKDSNDLWRIGRKYEREGGKRRRKNDDDDDDESRNVDDRVALGSNKGTSLEARLQSEMRAAKESGSMSAIFNVQEKAAKAGITLRR